MFTSIYSCPIGKGIVTENSRLLLSNRVLSNTLFTLPSLGNYDKPFLLIFAKISPKNSVPY